MHRTEYTATLAPIRGTDGNGTPERIQLVADGSEYAQYKRFRVAGTVAIFQRGQFTDNPSGRGNRFGQLRCGGTSERGFAGCLFKPFSISELMEVSDKCAIKNTQDSKPDFSALLSYGNEAVMLEKLITETEKEMQAVRDAATRNDLQELDALTHHLRSSWEILRADQPLRILYGVLHGKAMPEESELSHAVTAVLNMGAEIIRQAKEERRKYENG